MKRKETHEAYRQRILNVQMYIQYHLDEPLVLEELARVANFSPYHFHRIFSGMVGESVKEYVRRLRMERAALELMHNSDSITNIAFNAGYETHESFTRAFRAVFNVAPKVFRQQYKDKSVSFKIPHHQVRTIAADTKQKGKNMEAEIKKFDSLTVAAVRHVGPYAECRPAWEKLCGNPNVQKQFGPQTQFIGICYDDPDVTDPDKIRYDACATVAEGFEPDEGITKQTIAAGDYAVVFHKGSYSKLHSTYRWLFGQWLPESGREPQSAPSLEVCHSDPDNTPEDELLTEIRVPLK